MSVTPSRPSKARACPAKGEPSTSNSGKKMPSGPAAANSASTEVISVSPFSIRALTASVPPRAVKASPKALTRAVVYGSPSSTAAMLLRPSPV